VVTWRIRCTTEMCDLGAAAARVFQDDGRGPGTSSSEAPEAVERLAARLGRPIADRRRAGSPTQAISMMGHIRCHPEIRTGLSSVHILALRKYYEVRPHTMYPLQLIPVLVTRGTAGEHSSMHCDTCLRSNQPRVSGSTGMGSGLLKPDAVTLGRQAKGHWLWRRVVPGRWPLPTASISPVRDTPSRLFSTTQPPF
jgi:hypothetical protein